MFKKVLIANRGEIAVRGIRACRELGISPVAVYSEPDKNSLHVHMADEAVALNGKESRHTYLNIRGIIDAAQKAKCEAVFPGYGFLSENMYLARNCEAFGITWIGPHSETIRRMGDKVEAKKLMRKTNVPIVPGSIGSVDGIEEALAITQEIGFPIMIKASNGGGGKGLRVANTREELLDLYFAAQTEAHASFGSGGVYIEKFIRNCKHIEVQILGDKHGNIIHLGDRECSIQRRHQKLVEEARSPSIDDSVRTQLYNAAIKAARKVSYVGAGTVEFTYDIDSKTIYFCEMNTRLQVEHPITEMITGIDIVQEMIKVASGERLSIRQTDVRFNGHAIECRINAEDPSREFMPSPGKVERYIIPRGPGVRMDSHLYLNYEVPCYYDSLLGKLVVHAETREKTIAKMKLALNQLVIEGITTTRGLNLGIMAHPEFRNATYSTGFVSTSLKDLLN